MNILRKILAASLAVIFVNLIALPLGNAQAQIEQRGDILFCSPAPCVLPPVQPSNGGFVANAPIAANPLNPKQLILGSQNNNCVYPSFLGFYISNTGGSTWNLSCMVPLVAGNEEYEPDFSAMVAYDRNGTAYIAGFYIKNDDPNGFGVMAFEKSSDGGNNWSYPAVALQQSDAIPVDTWLTVDANVTSPYVNSVYISAVMVGPLNDNSKNQVTVVHSSDGGASWTQSAVAPVQTYPAGDATTNIAVGMDGTVYVAWMYCDTSPNFCQDNKGHIVFAKSSDGGNTWSKPHLIATVDLIGALPNTFVGITDTPVIGVDNSDGPHSGSLYVAMYSWTGSYMRVGVIRSTDGGSTWSRPVAVAPPAANHDQFFPWLSVSPTGLVGVSWLDRRNDPANVNYQAFAAISRDGGKSFQPNVQLTTAFSNPNNNGSGNDWMGNYTGNTWAGPDFVAAWMDTSNGSTTQDVVGGIRLK